MVKTPLFSSGSQDDIEKAKKLIDSVEIVIDCGCPSGDFNRFNAELINYAVGQGKSIIKTLAELGEGEL